MVSPIRNSSEESGRQQTPYRCQSRNHGLCAFRSSWRRFAAETSLGLSGLRSGSAKTRSSHSISEMVCSGSIHLNISDVSAKVKRSRCKSRRTQLFSHLPRRFRIGFTYDIHTGIQLRDLRDGFEKSHALVCHSMRERRAHRHQVE